MPCSLKEVSFYAVHDVVCVFSCRGGDLSSDQEGNEKQKNAFDNRRILFGNHVNTCDSGNLPGGENMYTVFSLTDRLPILFKIDGVSVIFAVMAVIVFGCAGVFSFEYMKHEEKEKKFYGFYLIAFGILIALCFAGNLITFYLFYEMLTLSSFPLVLHNRSREAVMAGLKYLFYSLCGAYMALFGLYFVERYGNTLTFSAGGVISARALQVITGFCF